MPSAEIPEKCWKKIPILYKKCGLVGQTNAEKNATLICSLAGERIFKVPKFQTAHMLGQQAKVKQTCPCLKTTKICGIQLFLHLFHQHPASSSKNIHIPQVTISHKFYSLHFSMEALVGKGMGQEKWVGRILWDLTNSHAILSHFMESQGVQQSCRNFCPQTWIWMYFHNINGYFHGIP